ncbi:TPA: hypothetical protein ACVU5E_000093 [Vibrio parahaemolyticus]|nr:hypothetical protein [Vibrio harveyi]
MTQFDYVLQEVQQAPTMNQCQNFEVWDDSHFDNEGWDDGGDPAP